MNIVQTSRLAAGLATLAPVGEHTASGALIVRSPAADREAAIEKLRGLAETVGYKVARIGLSTRALWPLILTDEAVPTMVVVSCDASGDTGLAKGAVRQCLTFPGAVIAFVLSPSADRSDDDFIDPVCDAVIEMNACGSGREGVEVVDLDA